MVVLHVISAFLLGCPQKFRIATVVLVLLFIASFWPAAWPEKLLSVIFSYMLLRVVRSLAGWKCIQEELKWFNLLSFYYWHFNMSFIFPEENEDLCIIYPLH